MARAWRAGLASCLAAGLAFAAPAAGAPTPRIAALAATLHDASPGAPVMVIAHRGCWKNAPENSIAAIEACIRIGIDMVEIDVRRTRDGQLVLMHDPTVNRTTDGIGAVAAMDGAAVRRLRLRRQGGRGTPVTAHTVPTLEEALLAARGRILVNLHLKVPVEDQVMALVDRLGMNAEVLMKRGGHPNTRHVATSPFAGRAYFMPQVRQCAKGPPLACSKRPRVPLAAWKDYDPVAYELVFRDLSWFEAAAAQARTLDRRIWVSTITPAMAAGIDDRAALADPEGHWGRLIAMGASMIQTDEPEALVDWLKHRH
ncbi:glycerophosphodiester phosphodiesterase family protein [Sphingomonas sp. LY54]|uniref:glycerophosphodiester phosphodiesterase family protein n=1 Tax=Sphingomonas sp. LY54 TaxID=3095343 RepID=UPI002D77FAA9|nr:glycerophosphodiester phosphodiesterase family protein [Sphingomonas sp. LY54]WRP27949.1 glycerophosphodiester phosphodiesterase family protein [Sphingomonas sp. LY54]